MAEASDPALQSVRQALLDEALRYPEATIAHPWGEDVVKVRGKVFVFFGIGGDVVYVTTKLPESHDFALMQPWTEPTGYGLARAGWVTAIFRPGDEPPVDILRQWIRESYRAVAPKRLVETLPPPSDGP
jgi:predicted DNA-binding protein (MmcQ/YjbR family)